MRIGAKIGMGYVISVLLPILIFSFTFYYSIIKHETHADRQRVISSLNRISNSVSDDIQKAAIIGLQIHLERDVKRVLNNIYKKKTDYIVDYSQYLAPRLWDYQTLFTNILTKITILSENPSLISGGFNTLLDDQTHKIIEYQENLSDKKNDGLTFLFSQEPGVNESYSYKQKMKLYMFHSLKYPVNREIGRSYLKLDLNYDLFKDACDEEDPGDFFLINPDGYIVWSYTDINLDNIHSIRQIRDQKRSKYTYEEYEVSSNSELLKGWKVVGIMDNFQYLDNIRNSRITILILFVSSILLMVTVILIINHSIVKKIRLLSTHFTSIHKEVFTEIEGEYGSDELGHLISEFNFMSRRIDNLITDKYKSEISRQQLENDKKQALVEAIQSRVNPHFLYNVLNTISIKSALKGERETSKIIGLLGRSFRRVLSWHDGQITINDELNIVKEYLEIQKYRFDEELSIEYFIDDKLLGVEIPKMILQILVENACIHGIEKVSGTKKICISILERDHFIEMSVVDNGIGMEKSRIDQLHHYMASKDDSSQSIGMRNVYRRIKQFLGEDAEILIESEVKKGTKVVIQWIKG